MCTQRYQNDLFFIGFPNIDLLFFSTFTTMVTNSVRRGPGFYTGWPRPRRGLHRRGRSPAGGGVKKSQPGQYPTGGGVKIISQGGGPAGGGVKIVSRGKAPPGAGSAPAAPAPLVRSSFLPKVHKNFITIFHFIVRQRWPLAKLIG